MRLISLVWLGAFALYGLFATGCGGAECGKGTTLVDGTCVSASSVQCAEGTELVRGRCVPTSGEITCGEGTTLLDGKCVGESSLRCGEGTELVEGECVPKSGDVECGVGTKLVDGKCVIESPIDCGEGTELVDGRCLETCTDDEVRVNGVCRLACDALGSPFGGGDGSWDSPFRICTAEHVLEVRYHRDKAFVLARNVDLSKVENFEPMGGANEGEGFQGHFDGAGLELRGLKIEKAEKHVGLFRRIEIRGSVRSLGLVDFNVDGTSHVGALAGFSEGTIQGTYVTGAVRGSGNAIGGLVGTNAGIIADSYTTGTVTGFFPVGGLVGSNSGGIVDSYATGEVKGLVSVGGLVGNGSGGIFRSFATGAVSGNDNVGGLVGESTGNIGNAYATGDVTGLSKVGGLVGNASGIIFNTYATGAISGSADIGGLIGIQTIGTPDSSYFLSDITDVHGEALTSDAFGDVSSFVDWDFDATWVMTSFASPDFSRPTLRTNPEVR